MSVDSGLSGPAEGPVAPAAPRAGTSPRVAPSRPARPGAARADALADAISPPSFRTGRGRPRRRGRRVSRIVRRIELWSVLKIALVFNTILLGIALGSVALLWGLANTTGLVDDLEGFLRDAGFEDFRFQGEQMFEQVAFIGAVGALAATVFMVLATALLNLISEITGGIRFVVIEEIVEQPAQPAQAPSPLALPTVAPGPPTAPGPPVAPPRPPKASPKPAANGRADRRAAPAPDDDPDAGPLSDARVALAKPSSRPPSGGSAGAPSARGRSGPAKRSAGRTSTAKPGGGGRRNPPAKPKPPSGPSGASAPPSSRPSAAEGGSGSAPARRVRRTPPGSSDASGDDPGAGSADAPS